MTLVRTFSWKGDVHVAVEFQFLWNDLVGLSRAFAEENLLADVFLYICDGVRNIRLRAKVLLPRIVFIVPFPSSTQAFFLRQREITLCIALVISNGGEGVWKKLSPFIRVPHMPDDLRKQIFVLIF